MAGGKFKLPKEYRHYDSFEDIEDSETYAYLDPTISNKLKNALANYTGTEQMGGRNDFLYTIHDFGVQIPLFVLKDCQYDEIRAIASESIKKIVLDWERLEANTFRYYIISVAEILTAYYNIEAILSTDEKSLIKRLLTHALGVDNNSIERKSICCDTIEVHSTNDVETNSESDTINDKDQKLREDWTIPDDFFTDNTGKYENYTCANHREIENKYTAESPKKLAVLIRWFVYIKKHIEENEEEINCFLLAISGKCLDKKLAFRPIKLKSVEAANNISAFIQILCKKPYYDTLNQLFIMDNYKWKSQDVEHRKAVEDKINEVYPKKETQSSG